VHNIYKTGAFLEPAPDPEADAARHCIGGRCTLKGATSPNTSKPLVQYAELYVASGEIACTMWNSPSISLLYSWTCGICEGPFSYRQTLEAIEVLQANSGQGYSDFPYSYYPEAFAVVPAALVPLTDHQRRKIAEINSATRETRFAIEKSARDLSRPRHQVGGVPYGAQDHVVSRCPSCKNTMEFLATMGNKTYRDALGFANNDFVQVVYEVCFTCNVITANNYVD
jgi:hypothetical protein